MTDFRYEVGADGVALITWDMPGRSMNVLTAEAMALVEDHVDRALADDAVRGIVITSGRTNSPAGWT